MQEICEVKRSYGESAQAKTNDQPYTVEEVEDEDEEEDAEAKEEGTGKVVVERTNVKITNDDGHSWEVTNEVVTFSSAAPGEVVPYKPFDYVRLAAKFNSRSNALKRWNNRCPRYQKRPQAILITWQQLLKQEGPIFLRSLVRLLSGHNT